MAIKWRLTLRLKLMFWFLCFSVIPIVAISYFSYQGSEKYFQNSFLGSLEGLAQVKSQAIGNFVNDRVLEISKFASMPSIFFPATELSKEVEATKHLAEADVPSEEPRPAAPVPQTPAPTTPEVATTPAAAEGAAEEAPADETKGTEEGIFEDVAISAANAAKVELQKKRSPVYENLNKQLELILGRGDKYEEIFLINLAGMVAISTFYGNEGKSAATADFFKEGLKTTYIQNIFVSEITKKLSMVIATPVKNDIGKTIAVLGARLNLDTFYKLIRDEKGLGKTGETVVAKKIGEAAVFMAPTRYDDAAALKRKVAFESSTSFPIQDATRGRSGTGVLSDYRDVRCFFAWQPIPVLDWGIAVKVDAKEALQPVLDMRNYIIFLTLGLLVLVVIMSTMISRGIVGPIRELTTAANSISKGDINVRIPTQTKDEVGDLADSFGRMVAAIRFLKEKQSETNQEGT